MNSNIFASMFLPLKKLILFIGQWGKLPGKEFLSQTFRPLHEACHAVVNKEKQFNQAKPLFPLGLLTKWWYGIFFAEILKQQQI